MRDIELEIRKQDWLYIIVIGILFGTTLSALGYQLLAQPIVEGAFFGALLGFFITLFSLVCISLMNTVLLPRLEKRYWDLMALFFSFLSGFLGTLCTIFLTDHLPVTVISGVKGSALTIAAAVGILTYIVGALLYRFVKMRNEKEQADHHLLQSRLRSLETQLNPHFLFNALNSVAELIHTDPLKAEAAVLKISAFMRNTMQEKALIAVRDELRNVRDYVDLENIRHNNRIALNTTLEDGVETMNVPKFSIQLLVENAIKHGLENRPLRISISVAHGSIRVANNGKALKDFQEGIGLSNLKERLERLCGGALEVVASDPPEFLITLGVNHEYSHCR